MEAFAEKERRWVMMVARFFIGVGAGTIGVMRAYAATASSLKDRARAITFIQASYVIGMTLGPGIQVCGGFFGFENLGFFTFFFQALNVCNFFEIKLSKSCQLIQCSALNLLQIVN